MHWDSVQKQGTKCNEVWCNKNSATKIEAVQVVIVVHQTLFHYKVAVINCGLQFITAHSAVINCNPRCKSQCLAMQVGHSANNWGTVHKECKCNSVIVGCPPPQFLLPQSLNINIKFSVNMINIVTIVVLVIQIKTVIICTFFKLFTFHFKVIFTMMNR